MSIILVNNIINSGEDAGPLKHVVMSVVLVADLGNPTARWRRSVRYLREYLTKKYQELWFKNRYAS
jgi:hypothetical protein